MQNLFIQANANYHTTKYLWLIIIIDSIATMHVIISVPNSDQFSEEW